MKITLWGTRGSLPSAGPDTVRYGGNTSCIEVRARDDTCLILDAGTGIRRLGAAIEPRLARVDILLTHLHMDHIQGLGFFDPLYRANLDVHVWGPPSTTLHLRTRLARYLSPPLFPVNLRELPCNLMLHDVPLGGFQIGGLHVTAALVCHPGPTVGYRIAEGATSMTFLPDHEPALGAKTFPCEADWTSGFDLAAGTDVLIHDAQYAPVEYAAHVGWGHSSISQALAFATLVGARRFVTFHHDPSHADAMLDRLHDDARRNPLPFDLIAGAEGAEIQI
jgi:phosphoribosyl 1,2-cyclic phosphodiesterase